jgi:hypothetical protein
MQLRSSALNVIAKMVCGDAPYNGTFPYRSSSYLTRFFEEIDLPYAHDGSTRFWWVRSVLIELNSKATPDESLPSYEMIKVIEYLLHPDHYVGVALTDQPKAVDAVNEVLRSHELEVVADPKTGVPSVRSTTGNFVSTAVERKKAQKIITFAPTVFSVPEIEIQERLVAVMMPFASEFGNVHEAIKEACAENGVFCNRADDIWANSAIMQDIFDLIFSSHIVIVDDTGRNSNVLYETGIAHTLGKTVIPITQSLDDIPFDLKPHRALKYFPNREGLEELSKNLSKRIKTILKGHPWGK